MYLASLMWMFALSAASPQDQPQVRIGQGALVGRRGDGVDSFRGLPYAAPPVGPWRWRPPQPAAPWDGARDAGAVGALCIQPPANGDNGVGPLPMSEDCLTLNVWAPADRARPQPVMVWIHGGGFNNGSGTAALYDGANLARRGVVVVTLNYRLGRLGFFDHPALAAERDAGEAGGNYGMMDIVAALAWVQDNIAAFSGDPGQVTVFGESAGGAAVTRLMISPAARGLFHRAIVQSGLGREVGTPLDRPAADGGQSLQDRGVAWATSQGLDGAAAGALRATPVQQLLTPAPSFYGGDNLVLDGAVVDQDVEAAFRAGRQAPVPLIIGTNSAEFWWVRPTEITPYGAADDFLASAEREALEAAYGGVEGYSRDVISDLIFNEPARHLARLHAASGNPTYLYRFDVVSEAMPEPHTGATHASERQYVFDNLTASPWPTEDRDQRAADAMAGYWTRFARTGDPNGGDAVAWPEMREAADRLLEFRNEGPAARSVPHAERLDIIAAAHARAER